MPAQTSWPEYSVCRVRRRQGGVRRRVDLGVRAVCGAGRGADAVVLRALLAVRKALGVGVVRARRLGEAVLGEVEALGGAGARRRARARAPSRPHVAIVGERRARVDVHHAVVVEVRRTGRCRALGTLVRRAGAGFGQPASAGYSQVFAVQRSRRRSGRPGGSRRSWWTRCRGLPERWRRKRGKAARKSMFQTILR